MVRVLLSSISSTMEPTYLPYIYGLLRTHAEQDPQLSSEVQWLHPIYRRDRPEVLLEDYDLSTVDVLGLSCYVWNWTAHCELARRVKEVNPECLVVAGGPHCDYDDPEFFRRYPYFDIVVEQEGEEVFRRILRKVVDGRSDWSEIPGLHLPGEDGEPTLTAPPERLTEEEFLGVSPYAAQSDVYRDIMEEIKGSDNIAAGLFESNRGCPYRCSFCDWGSLTYTKVRKFDIDRVKSDIEWLSRNKVTSFGITDANVGMFERDVEIMDYLCQCKDRYDYPKMFIYNPTKTTAEYLPEIVSQLHEHGLIPQQILSIQHTHQDVLEALDRRNLSDEELRELIAFSRERGMPVLVQLILGCPNDTYEKWKRCLTELMEWGVDGQFQVFNFDILPNAPVADPDYIEEYGIETTVTKNLRQVDIASSKSVPDLAKKHYITSTDTFDEDDWVDMWIYSYFVQSYHTLRLTQNLALYLHYCEDVSFYEFYSGLVDDLARGGGSAALHEMYRRIRREKEAFLAGEDRQIDRTELKVLPDYEYDIKWREWLFVHTMLNRDRVYEDIREYLLASFAVDERRVRDLVRYQKELMAAPDYSKREGKTFSGLYDWVEYFERPREELEQPPREGHRTFVVDDVALGDDKDEPITWDEHEGAIRLHEWIGTIQDPVKENGEYSTHTVKCSDPSLFQRVRSGARRTLERMRGKT